MNEAAFASGSPRAFSCNIVPGRCSEKLVERLASSGRMPDGASTRLNLWIEGDMPRQIVAPLGRTFNQGLAAKAQLDLEAQPYGLNWSQLTFSATTANGTSARILKSTARPDTVLVCLGQPGYQPNLGAHFTAPSDDLWDACDPLAPAYHKHHIHRPADLKAMVLKHIREGEEKPQRLRGPIFSSAAALWDNDFWSWGMTSGMDADILHRFLKKGHIVMELELSGDDELPGDRETVKLVKCYIPPRPVDIIQVCRNVVWKGHMTERGPGHAHAMSLRAVGDRSVSVYCQEAHSGELHIRVFGPDAPPSRPEAAADEPKPGVQQTGSSSSVASVSHSESGGLTPASIAAVRPAEATKTRETKEECMERVERIIQCNGLDLEVIIVAGPGMEEIKPEVTGCFLPDPSIAAASTVVTFEGAQAGSPERLAVEPTATKDPKRVEAEALRPQCDALSACLPKVNRDLWAQFFVNEFTTALPSASVPGASQDDDRCATLNAGAGACSWTPSEDYFKKCGLSLEDEWPVDVAAWARSNVPRHPTYCWLVDAFTPEELERIMAAAEDRKPNAEACPVLTCDKDGFWVLEDGYEMVFDRDPWRQWPFNGANARSNWSLGVAGPRASLAPVPEHHACVASVAVAHVATPLESLPHQATPAVRTHALGDDPSAIDADNWACANAAFVNKWSHEVSALSSRDAPEAEFEELLDRLLESHSSLEHLPLGSSPAENLAVEEEAIAPSARETPHDVTAFLAVSTSPPQGVCSAGHGFESSPEEAGSTQPEPVLVVHEHAYDARALDHFKPDTPFAAVFRARSAARNAGGDRYAIRTPLLSVLEPSAAPASAPALAVSDEVRIPERSHIDEAFDAGGELFQGVMENNVMPWIDAVFGPHGVVENTAQGVAAQFVTAVRGDGHAPGEGEDPGDDTFFPGSTDDVSSCPSAPLSAQIVCDHVGQEDPAAVTLLLDATKELFVPAETPTTAPASFGPEICHKSDHARCTRRAQDGSESDGPPELEPCDTGSREDWPSGHVVSAPAITFCDDLIATVKARGVPLLLIAMSITAGHCVSTFRLSGFKLWGGIFISCLLLWFVGPVQYEPREFHDGSKSNPDCTGSADNMRSHPTSSPNECERQTETL